MSDPVAAGVLPELLPLLRDVRRHDFSRPAAELRAAAAAEVDPRPAFVPRRDDVGATDVDIVAGESRVRLRVFAAGPTAAPRPALVYLHGGGWWQGDLDSVDPYCRNYAAASGDVVVAVEYRLAPEHPWPAAPEDCFAAVRWVRDHADRLGVDPSDIAVGGDSAGGNLAAVVALMCRDRGGPRLSAQWLDIPATDLTLPPDASLLAYGSGFGLDRDALAAMINWYVAPRDAAHPYASPLRAPSLGGLPPAVVTTAELDPLRDQGEAYARRLRAAGVAVRHTRWAGHLHSTMALTMLTSSARDYLDEVVAAVAEARELSRTSSRAAS